VLARLGTIFQHTSPFLAGRLKQVPEAAESARTMLNNTLGVVDAQIGSKKFVAGDRPTIADCTLFAALAFAEFAQEPIDPKFAHLHRWYETFKQRPSASA
jgi:glutathione S-transferase